MTRSLLDTNIVSFLMKRYPMVTRRFQSTAPRNMVLSTVVEAELRYGAQRLPPEASVHVVLQEFLRRINILPWDSACAERYGELRAHLESTGKGMEVSDTMIAAHALAHDLTLVTNDKAFQRVPGLRLEDWTKEQL